MKGSGSFVNTSAERRRKRLNLNKKIKYSRRSTSFFKYFNERLAKVVATMATGNSTDAL
jgi:hypothetical protein